MISTIIDRLGAKGYRYEKGYFNLEKVPDTVRPKTAYINMVSMGDNSSVNDFSLRSTSKIKPIKTIMTVNLIDNIVTVDHAQYKEDMRAIILSVLTLDKTNFPNVVQIEITGSRFVENDHYLIFSINISFTEI